MDNKTRDTLRPSRPKTPNAPDSEGTQIAILQKGYNLYGVGPDIEEALIDAREWLGRDDRTDENLPGLLEASDGEVCWAYCSSSLSRAILDQGGDIGYEESERWGGAYLRLDGENPNGYGE